jgi:hypothetical protein
VVSFPQGSSPKPDMHLSCLSCVPHAPPISFFMIWSSEYYLLRSTDRKPLVVHCHVTLCLLGPNIYLIMLLSNLQRRFIPQCERPICGMIRSENRGPSALFPPQSLRGLVRAGTQLFKGMARPLEINWFKLNLNARIGSYLTESRTSFCCEDQSVRAGWGNKRVLLRTMGKSIFAHKCRDVNVRVGGSLHAITVSFRGLFRSCWIH